MADEKPDDKAGEHDKALEKMADKLAKAAGSADVGALKEIVQGFYHDAVDLRAKNRELNTQLAEVKKKLPKDGELVLSGDDAKQYTELVKGAHGMKLSDIPKALADGSAASSELSAVKRDKVAEQIAKLTGQSAPLLKSLVRLHKLNIEVRKVPDPSGAKDGDGKVKQIEQAVVIPEGDKALPVQWDEYVEQNLGDFREALAGSEAERNGNREPPAPRIIRQTAGENGSKGVTDAELEQQVRQRHHFAV
jgi:hypothetical protein